MGWCNEAQFEGDLALLSHPLDGEMSPKEVYETFDEYIIKLSQSEKSISQLKHQIYFSDYLVHISPQYENGAYLILQYVSTTVEKRLIKEGTEAKEVKPLMEMLKERNFLVRVPVSDFSKAQHHFQEGNWSYLKKRFETKVLMGLFRLEENQIILFYGIILLLFLLLPYLLWKRPKCNF
ncbi:hypothetical protein AVL50_31030 [Flammeovirga sp. SJP92]|nr:hypothetical protein AVL50_31030 [Flammeovirga sp. SJP92]